MTYAPLTNDYATPKPASEFTKAANTAVRSALPFNDRRSFADAQRGFIATLTPLTIKHSKGHTAYDLSQFDFLQGESPDTVNPSLWRQAQLNAQHHGLFEICAGLYQVRSFDISNMTLIQGDQGWIIVDPLTSAESAQAALALANKHLGERPVSGVVITHSHVDHYAGIFGVVSPEDVASGVVPIIAPEHFVHEALSENVLVGNVMGRRATYMYGNLLKPGPQGFVTTGLGAALSLGTTGFMVPTDSVSKTGEARTIDGIDIEFQMTPGTEAPAEFVFFLPKFKALCMAEITSHHLHNVYTLRGAQVRDALAWSEQINASIDLFGERLDVQFASHHWPIWGREQAVEYLQKQRDLYKFIHDQSLRQANLGYTKEEIAERVHLPDALGQEFYNRGYYGSVHHNARAVYVKYLGYFDGNPATLHALPPSESGLRYVKAMGGKDAVVKIAQAAFNEGDYRWVAELLNHIMMIDAEHTSARALLADTLEQMGYQAESAPWRNFYLCGALELRHGIPGSSNYAPSKDVLHGMPLADFFKLMAVRLLPEVVDGTQLKVNFELSDTSETWLLAIENSVLNAFPERQAEDAAATVKITSIALKQILLGSLDPSDLTAEGTLSIQGQLNIFAQLAPMFGNFPRRFPIGTPREA